MAITNQANIRMPDELAERIDAAGARFNMSRAEIFLELAEFYFDLWLQAEEAKHHVITEQRAHFDQSTKSSAEKRR